MKKFLVFGGIILLLGIVINYSLGGFKPINSQLVSVRQSTLYGFNYEGSHSSDSLYNLVDFLRHLIDDEQLQGTLTIINYFQPELEKRGVIKQFIGVESTSSLANNEFSLNNLVIEKYNGIQFRIPIRPLVMPSPEKLKKLANEAAVEMNSELAGYSIEYYADNVLITNYPIK